uniref:SCAN box domain-containing protein n=1 Tax=Oryzias latipes TaxID=8090 RepID=A0A3P9IKY0_ORYLA
MTSGGPRGQQGRTAGAQRRPEAGRAHRPVPLSRMQALEACAELDRGRTDVYRAVRGVLRERRHNSPLTCCQRLRSAEVPSGRRPAGACGRRKGLCRGWERPERRTEERIGGVAVVERPQPVHPSDARTWVEEHAPEGWTGSLSCMHTCHRAHCSLEEQTHGRIGCRGGCQALMVWGEAVCRLYSGISHIFSLHIHPYIL